MDGLKSSLVIAFRVEKMGNYEAFPHARAHSVCTYKTLLPNWQIVNSTYKTDKIPSLDGGGDVFIINIFISSNV